MEINLVKIPTDDKAAFEGPFAGRRQCAKWTLRCPTSFSGEHLGHVAQNFCRHFHRRVHPHRRRVVHPHLARREHHVP